MAFTGPGRSAEEGEVASWRTLGRWLDGVLCGTLQAMVSWPGLESVGEGVARGCRMANHLHSHFA